MSLRPFKCYAPKMSPPVAKGTNQSFQVKVVSASVHVTTDSTEQQSCRSYCHILCSQAQNLGCLFQQKIFAAIEVFLMKIHNYLRLSQFVVVDHLRKSDCLAQNTLDPNRHGSPHRATERQITLGTIQNR
jgi:hypothetical protein